MQALSDQSDALAQTGGCSGKSGQSSVDLVKRKAEDGVSPRSSRPKTPPRDEVVPSGEPLARGAMGLGTCCYNFSVASGLAGQTCPNPPLEALNVEGMIGGTYQSGKVFCREHAVMLVECELTERGEVVVLHPLMVDRLCWR